MLFSLYAADICVVVTNLDLIGLPQLLYDVNVSDSTSDRRASRPDILIRIDFNNPINKSSRCIVNTVPSI